MGAIRNREEWEHLAKKNNAESKDRRCTVNEAEQEDAKQANPGKMICCACECQKRAACIQQYDCYHLPTQVYWYLYFMAFPTVVSIGSEETTAYITQATTKSSALDAQIERATPIQEPLPELESAGVASEEDQKQPGHPITAWPSNRIKVANKVQRKKRRLLKVPIKAIKKLFGKRKKHSSQN